MKKLLKSRALSWAVAVVGGIGMAGLQATPTVASFQQTPVAGKPVARFMVAAEGNEARYRIQEQLAGLDLPNDAVGVTKAVTGRIVLDKDNRIVQDSSTITVDVSTLVSDKTRRDGYVKRNTLETEKYPNVVFAPTEVRGLPAKLPTTGPVKFQVVGNLTIRGVTRFTIWNVTGQAGAHSYGGTAKTAFTFDDFKMTQPKVPVVLSVEDTIRLEYDFRMTKDK